MDKSFKALLMKKLSKLLIKPSNSDTIVSKLGLGSVGNTLNIESIVRIQTIIFLSLMRSAERRIFLKDKGTIVGNPVWSSLIHTPLGSIV
jgi:hypothetical protein